MSTFIYPPSPVASGGATEVTLDAVLTQVEALNAKMGGSLAPVEQDEIVLTYVTVGNGIGHDITAILDGNTAEPIVLNDFYVSDLDTYQSGKLEYNFSRLAPGNHTLDFKVWDVNNNSSSVRIEFTVAEKQELALDHVLNYPNPFTTRTTFFFEHNQVCESLETQIQIFTISGKLVRTINQLVRTNGFRTEGVDWDGRDEYGDQLAKGVYIYRLSVKSPDGDLADKTEKLVLLK
jgi:hypothetical protein